MDIPLLQTEQWQNFQKDLGETTFFEKTPDFQYLAIKKVTPFGNYLYLPYGPVAENSKSFKLALKSLVSLAKTNSAIFIRIEPRSPKIAQILQNKAIKTISSIKTVKKSPDLNPKETWVLDLPQNPEELRKKLPDRLFRYWKKHQEKGLRIETSKNPADIKYLVNLQKNLAKTKKISIFSEEYLKTQLAQPFATLYLVKQRKESSDSVIAAGLIFDDKTTRYNLQGAQSSEGAKNHATGILTIQLIMDAATKNQKFFDFWGIAPENAPKNHPWAGFTTFKKTFAGREQTYAGDYDLILNPAKYHLYQLTRKINRFIRRFKS